MPPRNSKQTTLRRFFIPPEMASAAIPEITGTDAGHICRVLRLTAGDAVELFDGTGNGYRAQIVSASPRQVRLTITDSFILPAESPVQIVLAQAMLKDRKMDQLVRQLTELGIYGWIPFYSGRSVPVPRRKGMVHRMARWQKIALEAVKQCRRGRVPEIAPVEDFNQLLETSDQYDLRVLFWEETPQAFDLHENVPQKPKKLLLVVGPEGGFTSDEVQRAKAQDFLTAGLGPRILRAETAALAAFTLVQYCFGDMGRGEISDSDR